MLAVYRLCPGFTQRSQRLFSRRVVFFRPIAAMACGSGIFCWCAKVFAEFECEYDGLLLHERHDVFVHARHLEPKPPNIAGWRCFRSSRTVPQAISNFLSRYTVATRLKDGLLASGLSVAAWACLCGVLSLTSCLSICAPWDASSLMMLRWLTRWKFQQGNSAVEFSRSYGDFSTTRTCRGYS